jgi:hypothetical protein
MDLKLIISIASVAVTIVFAIIVIIRINRTRQRIYKDFPMNDKFMRNRLVHDDTECESLYRKDYPNFYRNKQIEGNRNMLRSLGSLYVDDNEENDLSEKKKEKFLNIANISFHFADKERIKTFYNDYFKEPTIKDLIKETVSETNSDLKGGIPSIIESKIGGKDLSKWISKIKLPDLTETGMFKRYQQETIKNNQVKLGLEDDDIELSVLSDFEIKTKSITKEFGYNFDPFKLQNQKTILKEKAAERTLNNLEKASGWILIEGNFLIEKDNDFYKISMTHPVSNYLASGKKVTLSCLIHIDKIESSVSGNYSNSINQSIPLRIYGQVWHPISRQSDNWELVITPLAIY